MKADVRLIEPFQTVAVEQLRERVANALRAQRRSHVTPQVVSFTAPTGSGKTIIMTALIENILCGDEEYYPAQENAIFLWLSDSPQLNEQSRQKIEQKSSEILPQQCITIEEKNFDQRVLDDGHIYFVNTQKFGEKSNLTKKGDKRNYTIWETLANTAREKSDHFYVIIDEAHRGAKDEKPEVATTIMQRFLKGHGEIDFPAMPVIIGMSATIDRFKNLVGNLPTGCSAGGWDVSPKEVQESGLLKDQIWVNYQDEKTVGNEMAILKEAAINWKKKCDSWAKYCEKQHKPDVNPVFVVQVEKATKESYSATDLGMCIKEIEECLGRSLKEGEVVHTFSEVASITVNGLEIPYKEPSSISDNKEISVVFFKESLSTGWDCPRAETMMSFHRAVDATYIAQLLGRMVRTPLQRRIETDTSLNDVSLYLPYFNKDNVKIVVDYLKGQIPQTTVKSVSEKASDTLTIYAPALEGGFSREEIQKFINEKAGLISYNTPDKRRVIKPVPALFKMAHFLKNHDLDSEVVGNVISDIVQMIHDHVEKLKQEGKYLELISQKRKFKLSMQRFNVFGEEVDDDSDSEAILLESTDENIDYKFRAAERKLGNEGIGVKYSKRFFDESDPNASDSRLLKIDVIIFIGEEKNWNKLEQYAKGKLCKLVDAHRRDINALPDEAREEYKAIVASGVPEKGVNFRLPETIVVVHHEDGEKYSNHLFVDENTKTATIKYDSAWEKALIEEEQKRKDFVCWIRNDGSWALAIPYEYTPGEMRLTYPDFIIVRKDESRQGYVVDILEPHNYSSDDFYGKARGYAKYAKENPGIGRVQMLRQVTFDGKKIFKRLDMATSRVNEEVRTSTSVGELKKKLESLEI